MRLPNFLVIGAPRSGTTMLHYSLGQHPEIFVSPNKETNFFLFDGIDGPPSGVNERDLNLINYRAVTTLAAYAALFADATDAHRAIGESSPSYLVCPEVAPRIKARLPEARLVAILRHPVEQALSLYKVQQVQQGGTLPTQGLTEGFVEAMTAEQAQAPARRDGLTIIEYGLYHRHLAAFFEHFDRSQIKVVLLEELQRDSAQFFADLFRFLGVDDSFQPELSQRYNETGAARSVALHRVLYGSHGFKRWMRSVLPRPAAYHLARLQHRLLNANLDRRQNLPLAMRPELTKRFYADDIGALEELLGRDLAIWRQ